MAEILVDSITVQFPIFDVNARSLRKELMRMSTGGRIQTDVDDHVVITALENVSFTLREGDRLGIIGPNGAGKSTLLRAIAGIYEPHRGRICVRGRVAPLFDITLGMDSDATGYENIKIRGLFLQMTPAQIKEHASDIVAFSELGSYMNMPIRTYSTGMRVRLAFAIATAQPSDILLFDEMIGAGDAKFIDRAQERLERFLGRARIVVIASHSDEIIRRMCNKAMLLDHGKLIGIDSVDEILKAYASLIATRASD
ncbi:MAG: ABC transporter ATP-binding protein [Myxococcota bacterium]